MSQDINVKLEKSNEFKDEHKWSSIVLSEVDNSGDILLVRSHRGSELSPEKGFYIERYNTKLNLLHDFDFEIQHSLSEKNSVVIGVFTLNNVIQIVDLFYDIKDKAYICQVNSITPEDKVFKKELFRLSKEEIASYGEFSLKEIFNNRGNEVWTNPNTGELESNSFSSTFISFAGFFKSSIDKIQNSKIALVVNQSKNGFAIAMSFNGKISKTLKFFIFDSLLNLKNENQLEANFKEGNSFFQNIRLSENGSDLYLLSKVFCRDLKDKKEGGKYVFELTKFSGSSRISQKLDIGDYYINSLNLSFHNDELICLGFYSDINDYKFKGVICFKLASNTLSILQSKFNPFTAQFLIDKYGENNTKGVKFLNFRKLFFTSDNEIIFNAEEEYSVSNNVGGFGMSGVTSSGSQSSNHFDDIVSIKLSSEGDMIWARNINKKQSVNSSDGESYISYSSMNKDNSTYFFINTGEKINKIKNDRIEFGQVRKNKSNLNVIKISPSGDFDYQELLDDENSAVPFMVSKGVLLKDNTMLFLGRKGSTKQLLKVTI